MSTRVARLSEQGHLLLEVKENSIVMNASLLHQIMIVAPHPQEGQRQTEKCMSCEAVVLLTRKPVERIR